LPARLSAGELPAQQRLPFPGDNAQGHAAFLGVLAEFTLQDLVKDSDKMCGLLDLEIPVREA